MRKLLRTCTVAALCSFIFLSLPALHAQVPQLLNYQGRVAVGTVNFNGSGAFKFALVNAAGTTTYWSNDGTSTAGSQPTGAVTLTVTKGLYSVLLGDISLANMTAIPNSVFANADVRLRVWFNDGTNGFQLLTPDQRLAPNGYLPDGSVTSAKLAAGSVGTASIAAGIIGSTQLAAGAVAAPLSTATATVFATANTSHVATGAAATNFILPTTANIGDTVHVSATGAGGWQVVNPPIWTPRESNRAWYAMASSADGAKLVAVVNGGQIYTSADSGVTWTPRDAARTWSSVASSADGTKLVAVVSNGQIYTSTNSGVSWAPRDVARNWISVASSADGTKLVAAVLNGQLYTSTNSGVTWTPRDSIRAWTAVASSADGSKLVAAVYFGGIHTSTDSGVTWTPRANNEYWSALASSADGTKLVAVIGLGIPGAIHTSTDSGATWVSRGNLRDWRAVASSADGTKLVAVARNSPIHTSVDSGAAWIPSESSRSWQSVASSSDGSLVAGVDNGQVFTAPEGEAFNGGQGESRQFQYLGNGVWQPVTGLPSGPQGYVEFTIPGSNSWVCPAGVTTISVKMWGAGGGGGGGASQPNNGLTASVNDQFGTPHVLVVGGSGGGGGGAGAYMKAAVSVTPGHTYTINVGTAGTAGAVDTNGGNGSSTQVLDGATVLATVASGGGGVKGVAQTSSAATAGGAGGAAGAAGSVSLTLNRSGGVSPGGSTSGSGSPPGGGAFVGDGYFGSVPIAGGSAFSNELSPTSSNGGTGGRGQRAVFNSPYGQSASAGGAGSSGYVIVSLY